MTEKKIEIKIGRYIKYVNEKDLILDNGACIQLVTQTGKFIKRGHAPLTISKKLFKELKKCAFIFVDEEKTKKANKFFKSDFLIYYRFDIEQMIRSDGYKAVEK